jgi:putative SOS response-associated peptidase YedK
VFLLACVRAEDRFSVVTTVPNSTVFPVHDRMPLVLGRGESQRWLNGDFAGLANRGSIKLTSELES